MSRKTKIVLPVVFASLLFATTAWTGQPPAENISGKRHPNLAAAQGLARRAWEKIVAAQQANEWDMQGHAQKAKELLDQVNNELRMAATASNEHR